MATDQVDDENGVTIFVSKPFHGIFKGPERFSFAFKLHTLLFFSKVKKKYLNYFTNEFIDIFLSKNVHNAIKTIL